MTFEDAVREVYFWQYNRTDCFTQLLLDLFQKADEFNKIKLGLAYPELYKAWCRWHEAGDYGNDLFRELGLME